MNINIILPPEYTDIDHNIVEETARTTFSIVKETPQNEFELSIVFTDQENIREMNRSYRNIDSSTDVLSFPAAEIDPDTGALYLGDVIISYQNAKQQAQSASHSLTIEIQILIVHGILHLLGYDHIETADKNKMWAQQNKIFKNLEIPIINL